jgi:hypothetical protein
MKKVIRLARKVPLGQTTQLLGLMGLTAIASYATGTNFPWNNGLSALSGNLTGQTALAIATLGGVGTIAGVMHQGEMNHFVQKTSHYALGGGALLAIPSVLRIFGVAGAHI